MFRLSKDELLHGNIYKGLLVMSIPLILLNLINILYGIVDTYFVGLIDELEVGAISLINPIVSCGNAFATGLCAAGIALISRYIGKGDDLRAKNIASSLITLSIILGIFTFSILIIFGKDILIWFETPIEIFDSTMNYLIGISFDFTFLFIVSIYQAIRQGHGDSKSGVIINMIAAIFNCILDPIFIFTFNLGTLGAALATCISKALMTPVALYLLKKNDLIGNIFNIDFSIIKEIILVAIPSSIGNFLSSFGFILMQKEIASYGSIALSAYGIGSKISSIYYIFVNCWGSALTTFVGSSIGMNNPKRARQAFRSSMVYVSIVSLIFIPLGLLTSRSFVMLFIKDISQDLLDMSLEYAYYSIFTAFCMGWMNNLGGVFNGSSNTLISMLLTGSRIWFIRMPIIYYLNRVTTLGVTNIWIAMCISNIIVCTIGQIFYHAYNWQDNHLKI